VAGILDLSKVKMPREEILSCGGDDECGGGERKKKGRRRRGGNAGRKGQM
jgi:hypothetical protein